MYCDFLLSNGIQYLKIYIYNSNNEVFAVLQQDQKLEKRNKQSRFRFHDDVSIHFLREKGNVGAIIPNCNIEIYLLLQ